MPCMYNICTLLIFKLSFTSNHDLEYAMTYSYGRLPHKKNDVETG